MAADPHDGTPPWLPDGRILIIEIVIDPDTESTFGKTMDVFMMNMLSGKERTEAEFAALLGGPGFGSTA